MFLSFFRVFFRSKSLRFLKNQLKSLTERPAQSTGIDTTKNVTNLFLLFIFFILKFFNYCKKVELFELKKISDFFLLEKYCVSKIVLDSNRFCYIIPQFFSIWSHFFIKNKCITCSITN